MRFPQLEDKIDVLTELMREVLKEMRKTNAEVKRTGNILKESNEITKGLENGNKQIGTTSCIRQLTNGTKENKRIDTKTPRKNRRDVSRHES